METAPLTLAHTHARNAVQETRKTNPVAASEEHDLAAGEFAAAAQGISDREALRTLHLLEAHHKSLAHILRFQHEHPSSSAAAEPSAHPPPSSATQDPTGKKAPPVQDVQQQQQPPKLSGHARLPTRETSSIASNLASARGIPSHHHRASTASPTRPSRTTDTLNRIHTGDPRRPTQQPYDKAGGDRSARAPAPKQPWSPPTVSPTEITSRQIVPPEGDQPAGQKTKFSVPEEPFQRFYSTFEDLISKLSAPLAFAGLPLGSDSSTQANANRRKSGADPKLDHRYATSDRSSPSAEPDVDRLFSRAALRAVRDSNGGSTASPAESFYVVPTTGGTVSYAGILSRAEKEARRNSIEEVEEDFVDARETPSSSADNTRQSLPGGAKGRIGRRADHHHHYYNNNNNNNKFTTLQNSKTVEELHMENQALKHLSDTLSRRLHMWEVNAQSSSMALQQSLKAMHHPPISSDPPSPIASATTPTAATPSSSAPAVTDLEQRIRDLNDIRRRMEKDLERSSRENEKLKDAVSRYRARWDRLKEGAKTRRAESKPTDGSVPVAPTTEGNNKDESVAAAAVDAEYSSKDVETPTAQIEVTPSAEEPKTETYPGEPGQDMENTDVSIQNPAGG